MFLSRGLTEDLSVVCMSSTLLVGLQLMGLCGSLLEVDTGGLLSLLKGNK